MIGYYIHHHGRGHLSRATAIAGQLDVPVTGLSSAPRPAGWPGEWVQLPLDQVDAPDEATANERLHYVPLGSSGLRERMAAISAWIDTARPDAVVVDVSVEVALLVRLHGVPVVTVALPGCRDDAAHTLGFGVSAAVIAAWPAEASGMLIAHTPVHTVGAISMHTSAPPAARTAPSARRVLVLSGTGGDDFTPAAVERARRQTASWHWHHLGGSSGQWSLDPWPDIVAADVVVTHAGENAIAEVAAARRPAIVIPQLRPFGEQFATGRALDSGPWPVIVRPGMPTDGWAALLEAAVALRGDAWAGWNDGLGARRAAAVIRDVASGRRLVA